MVVLHHGKPDQAATTTSEHTKRGRTALFAALIIGCMGLLQAVPSRAQTSGAGRLVHGHVRKHAALSSARCKVQNRASGTLRLIEENYFTTLNPYQIEYATQLTSAMFDDLFRYDNRERLFPMMAAAVPSLANGGIQDGGRTVIIRLKRGLRWSNGAEITAADIRFGWQIARDPASGPWCAGTCDVITGITAPDRYTAVLHLKHAYPPIISPLVFSYISGAFPVPWPSRWPHAWNENPHAAAVKLFKDPSFNFGGPDYPTDGPYQVQRFVKGGPILLRPMKYYDDMTCGGFIQTLSDRGSGAAGEMSAAATGQADITTDYFSADLPELRRHTNMYHLYVEPALGLEHLELNVDLSYNGNPNPLADARVRLALALALDKAGVIERALALGTTTTRAIEAWTPWTNTPSLVQPFADRSIRGQWDPIDGTFTAQTGQGRALEHARQLLARTHWKHGFSLDYYTAAGNSIRRITQTTIAAEWARVGVKVNQHRIPADKLFADWNGGGPVDHGAFQVAEFTTSYQVDPDSWKFSMESRYIDRAQSVHNPINDNFSGIRDPVIDQAFARAGSTFDRTVRYRNYRLIQLEMNKRAYWIPLFFRPDIYTASSRVRNFAAGSVSGPAWNIYAWTVRAG